jgi:phytoene/squalene synthetase
MLADRERADDAYRAYAYFRWVDDWLDGPAHGASECRSFAARQLDLIDRCYAGDPPAAVTSEESILVDLIDGDPDRCSPLAAYIENMIGVMSFDAGRRGQVISQVELNAYQRRLAVAVTEAMHYFIGQRAPAPRRSDRYLAVTAAHITHMLRDTREDVRAGYFNISSEFLRARGISPLDVDDEAYRDWVRTRIDLARRYFAAGRRYFRQVPNPRCRLAAYAYTARFEIVLDMIERDGFRLRQDYGACKTLGAALHMAGSVVRSAMGLDPRAATPRPAAHDGLAGSR